MSLKIHNRTALLVGTLGILFFMGIFAQSVYADRWGDTNAVNTIVPDSWGGEVTKQPTTVVPDSWGGEATQHLIPTQPSSGQTSVGQPSSLQNGQTNGNTQPSAIGGESGNTSVGGSGNVSIGGSGNTSVNGGSMSLTNPLKATTISGFLLAVIDVILVFALPLIVLYIMYAGFLYVTARGEPGQITTARSALLWAIVGGVIVLGAKLIVSVIQGTIQAF